MKNNKGFVISTTLYSIFGIMLLTVFYILYLLSNNRYVLTSSIDEVKSGLEKTEKKIYVKIVYDDDQYSDICDEFQNIEKCESEKIYTYKEKILSGYEITDTNANLMFDPQYLNSGSYTTSSDGTCDYSSTWSETDAKFVGLFSNYLLFSKDDASGNISGTEPGNYKEKIILSALPSNMKYETVELGCSDYNIINSQMTLQALESNRCLNCNNNICTEITTNETSRIDDIRTDGNNIYIKMVTTLYPTTNCCGSLNCGNEEKTLTYYYKVSLNDIENNLNNNGLLNVDLLNSIDINSLPYCSVNDYYQNPNCSNLNITSPPNFYTTSSCTLQKNSIGVSCIESTVTSPVVNEEYESLNKLTAVVLPSVIKNEIEENKTNITWYYGNGYTPYSINLIGNCYDLPQEEDQNGNTIDPIMVRINYTPKYISPFNNTAYFKIVGKKKYSEEEGYVYNFDINSSISKNYDEYYYIILGKNIDGNSDLRFTENFYTSQNDYKKIIYLNDNTKSSEFSENLMGSTQIITNSSDIITDIKNKIK